MMGMELASPREWVADALCAQTDWELFFPDKGGPSGPAQQVCMACPTRLACLEYALDNNERFGIWGGLSERQRRRLKANRAREREAA